MSNSIRDMNNLVRRTAESRKAAELKKREDSKQSVISQALETKKASELAKEKAKTPSSAEKYFKIAIFAFLGLLFFASIYAYVSFYRQNMKDVVMHYLPTPEICATLSEEFAKSLKSSIIAPDDDLPAPDREKIMASLSIFKEEPFGISSVHKAGTGEDGRQLFKIACLTRDKTFEFLVDYSRGECKILSSDSRRNEYPLDF